MTKDEKERNVSVQHKKGKKILFESPFFTEHFNIKHEGEKITFLRVHDLFAYKYQFQIRNVSCWPSACNVSFTFYLKSKFWWRSYTYCINKTLKQQTSPHAGSLWSYSAAEVRYYSKKFRFADFFFFLLYKVFFFKC